MDLSYGTKRRLQYQDPSTDFRLSHQQPAARGECFQHSGASGRAGRKPQPHHGVPLSGQAGRGAAHHEIRCRQGRKSRVPVRGRGPPLPGASAPQVRTVRAHLSSGLPLHGRGARPPDGRAWLYPAVRGQRSVWFVPPLRPKRGTVRL